MKLYVAGPMLGYPDSNFPAFEQARFELEALGHEVFCPTDNELENPTPGEPQSFDWYLRRDLTMVVQCDGLALLPGFEASRGAALEVHVAHALGIRTLPLNLWLNTPATLFGGIPIIVDPSLPPNTIKVIAEHAAPDWEEAFEAWIYAAYLLSKEATYRRGTHWHRQREAFRAGFDARDQRTT